MGGKQTYPFIVLHKYDMPERKFLIFSKPQVTSLTKHCFLKANPPPHPLIESDGENIMLSLFSCFLSTVQLFLQLVFYFLILSLGLNTKSLDKACGCILLYTNKSIFTEMVDGRKSLLQDKLMGLF